MRGVRDGNGKDLTAGENRTMKRSRPKLNEKGVFDTFEVPLDDKEGKEEVKTDFLEETFLTMCQLKRIDGMWRVGTGEGRRRDDDETPAENVENVEVNKGEEVQQDFDREQVEEDAEIQGEEQVEEEAEVQGEPRKKRVAVEYSRS
ncbi:hypothetical protein Dimus_003459 [Dionaea muscipula]